MSAWRRCRRAGTSKYLDHRGLSDPGEITVLQQVSVGLVWLADHATRTARRLLPLVALADRDGAGTATRTGGAAPRRVSPRAAAQRLRSDGVLRRCDAPRGDAGRSRTRVPSARHACRRRAVVRADRGFPGRRLAAETDEGGELFVGGMGVGLGYVRTRGDARSAFYRDLFDPGSPTGRLYRTGDLVSARDGHLAYQGRAD
jgi:D-alanine--poly(phosphoribitol) ligase subunit 1